MTNSQSPETPESNQPGSPLGEVDLLGETPIWTPEIERLTGAVCESFRMGFVGMAVDGLQRCGKSSACEFLQDTLAEALGYPLATFYWTCSVALATAIRKAS